MFYVFKNMKFESKMINWISSSTLEIHLIHDNNYLSKVIREGISPNKNYMFSRRRIVHFLVEVTLIFVICLLIDKIRILVFGKVEKKLSEKIEEWLKSKKWFNKVFVEKVEE